MNRYFKCVIMILGIIINQSCKKDDVVEANKFHEKILESPNWYLQDFSTSPKLKDQTIPPNFDEFSIGREGNDKFRIVFFSKGQLVQTISEATFINAGNQKFVLDGAFNQMYFSSNTLMCKSKREYNGQIHELNYQFSTKKPI